MCHHLSLSFLLIWCRLQILISVALILSPRSVMNMLNNADSSTKPHWPLFQVRGSDIHNPLLFSKCLPVVFNFIIDYFSRKNVLDGGLNAFIFPHSRNNADIQRNCHLSPSFPLPGPSWKCWQTQKTIPLLWTWLCFIIFCKVGYHVVLGAI